MKKSKIILLGIIFSFIGFSYASELPINNTIQQEDLQLNIFKKNKKSRKSKKMIPQQPKTPQNQKMIMEKSLGRELLPKKGCSAFIKRKTITISRFRQSYLTGIC